MLQFRTLKKISKWDERGLQNFGSTCWLKIAKLFLLPSPWTVEGSLTAVRYSSRRRVVRVNICTGCGLKHFCVSRSPVGPAHTDANHGPALPACVTFVCASCCARWCPWEWNRFCCVTHIELLGQLTTSARIDIIKPSGFIK